jgi:hypothetical protein
MAARALAKEFGEPCLVFDFLVEDGEREIVGAMVLAESHVADFGITTHRAALGFYKNLQHVLDVGWIGRDKGRRASGNVVEVNHAFRQVAAKFVDSRHQCLEMIAIFDPSVFGNFLKTFAFEAIRLTRKIL